MIVGLMGPAGSGKSTVAGYIHDRYGGRRYSLAAPLKELAIRTLDFSHEQVYGTQAEKEAIDPRYGFSPRWFLQRLGTNACREIFGPGFWSDFCLQRILKDAPKLAVIEDVRFQNEAEAIYKHDGVVIRLFPPANEHFILGDHPSEREWTTARADFSITPQSRGVDELFDRVDALFINYKLGVPL